MLGAALAAALALAASAGASAPPVGKLPPGPLTTISAKRGSLVAIALPHRPNGLVWRQAGGFGTKVVRESSEADIGKDVVVVFRATARGRVTLAYGLTRVRRRVPAPRSGSARPCADRGTAVSVALDPTVASRSVRPETCAGSGRMLRPLGGRTAC